MAPLELIASGRLVSLNKLLLKQKNKKTAKYCVLSVLPSGIIILGGGGWPGRPADTNHKMALIRPTLISLGCQGLTHFANIQYTDAGGRMRGRGSGHAILAEMSSSRSNNVTKSVCVSVHLSVVTL